jgi:HSP20 family molecular chaperone IbpA
MNERKEMKPQNERGVQTRSETDLSLRPAVDIYEDERGITLKADLPGVSRERLSIQVDGNTLAIEGQISVAVPEGTEALYADVRANRFQRSFTLSNELDTDNISAEMRDGVLTLSVPKRAEHQPRRIEVKAG